MFENMVLSKIFGHKGAEVAGVEKSIMRNSIICTLHKIILA
jgi:hypothetical protein